MAISKKMNNLDSIRLAHKLLEIGALLHNKQRIITLVIIRCSFLQSMIKCEEAWLNVKDEENFRFGQKNMINHEFLDKILSDILFV